MRREMLVVRMKDAEKERCGSPACAWRGDNDLNPDMKQHSSLILAAVLIPLIERCGEFTVMFTRRSAHLTYHPGQICFPGGRINSDDDSPQTAALRETHEEVGLSSKRVELNGELDIYVTRTGFQVTPGVGIVRPPVTFHPDPVEVAEVFEVPLAYVTDPENYEQRSQLQAGQRRYFYVLTYKDRIIWGATAGMLVNLAHVLQEK